jgi:hypothetical protein
VEVDSALALGLTAEELCTCTAPNSRVLYGYDRKIYLYDVNGRRILQEVPSVWRKNDDDLTADERTATNAAGNT